MRTDITDEFIDFAEAPMVSPEEDAYWDFMAWREGFHVEDAARLREERAECAAPSLYPRAPAPRLPSEVDDG